MTVETTYTADGQIATLTAKNPTTGDQVTTYVYGTTLADSDDRAERSAACRDLSGLATTWPIRWEMVSTASTIG